MSGRERLRHGWLRFGKVRRKPNKDGKNRLCLEKNRCREEEEFPVVKGISKRVIVVKSPDPKVFEQAIFIIREDFAGQSGISEKDVLRQARAAAEGYLGGGKSTGGSLHIYENRSRSKQTGSDFFGCVLRGGMVV